MMPYTATCPILSAIFIGVGIVSLVGGDPLGALFLVVGLGLIGARVYLRRKGVL